MPPLAITPDRTRSAAWAPPQRTGAPRVLLIHDRLGWMSLRRTLDADILAGDSTPRVDTIWCTRDQQLLARVAHAEPTAIAILTRADPAVLAQISALRERTAVPIVVITPTITELSLIQILERGADVQADLERGDEVVQAYVRAMLRRAPGDHPTRLEPAPVVSDTVRAAAAHSASPLASPLAEPHGDRVGPLVLEQSRRHVLRHGAPVRLTRTEFGLLRALTDRPGEVRSHAELYRAVWGERSGDVVHYVRVYVRALREKLEDNPSNPTLIQTIPRHGYRFCIVADPSTPSAP